MVSLGAMTIEIRTFCTVDLTVTLRHYIMLNVVMMNVAKLNIMSSTYSICMLVFALQTYTQKLIMHTLAM